MQTPAFTEKPLCRYASISVASKRSIRPRSANARRMRVRKRDSTDMHRCLVKLGRTGAVSLQALPDDPQKNAQRTVQRCRVALHEVAQPLWHRQHPLVHREVRKNMVHQVRRRLVHAPRVAEGHTPRPLQAKATT